MNDSRELKVSVVKKGVEIVSYEFAPSLFYCACEHIVQSVGASIGTDPISRALPEACKQIKACNGLVKDE